MNIGIMGLGAIAHTLADTMNRMESEDIHLFACASRDENKALAFKEQYHVDKAYSSYEDMVKDEDIDLVYIATPHSEHYKNIMLCLENGRNVLCEKAFTVNERQAKEVINYARSKRIFLAEAIWTRYMPIRKVINDLIANNTIGKVKSVTADLGYVINKKKRLVDPHLAGGALLDVGIYPLNFASMFLGNNVTKVEAICTYTDKHLDDSDSITLVYSDNTIATLTCSMSSSTSRIGTINGNNGYIVVNNINNPEKISIYDVNNHLIREMRRESQISGYEYELRECRDAIMQGAIEPISMPHDETLEMMAMLDKIREKMDIKYPNEDKKLRWRFRFS